MTEEDENSNESILQRIYREEEHANIVLSIREELMQRVMEECHQSYIKKQIIRFMVQCAYDAMVKSLSFYFYYHPEVPDSTESIWVPDDPIEPSPKDTWACDAVPFKTSEYKDEDAADVFEEAKLDEQIARLSKHSNKSHSSKSSKSSRSNMDCKCTGHECICLTSPEDIPKKLQPTPTQAKPCPSKVKFSQTTVSSKLGARGAGPSLEDNPHFSETSTTQLSQKDSLTSSGITGTSGQARSSEISIKKQGKQNKETNTMEIPENLHRASQVSVVTLPPIRVKSTFQSKPSTVKKKPYATLLE